MKRNKLVSLLLVFTMLTSLVAGCAKSNTPDTSANVTASPDTTQAAQDTSAAQGDPTHIVVTYITLGTTPTDLLKVQDAVNAISIPEINVEVEFKPIGISDTFTNYSLWISSGEQVDLMMLAFQNVASYTGTGSLEPLTELVNKSGTDIAALAKDYPIFHGATVDGELYGISPVMPTYGIQGSVILRSDIVKEAGIEVKDKYSMDDLTDVFAAVKNARPDMYPYGILGSSVGTTTSFSFFNVMDTLGSGVNTGVLLGTDSTKITDLFETEDYYNFLQTLQEWYKAGYILPDAATTDSLMPELMNSNAIVGVSTNYTPNIYADYDSNMAPLGGATAFLTTDAYYPSFSATNGTYWTIPITSVNPDAAMKFLNLTYANTDLMNLIQWGFEDVNYVKADSEGLIKFPEGIDPSTTTYYNTLGLWGDARQLYYWSAASSRPAKTAFTEAAMSNATTAAAGYAYNTSTVTNQIVAIDTVLRQYLPSLETGSVEDLDTVYKEFISALKAAGIDDVIADNQSQFDAWLASNS